MSSPSSSSSSSISSQFTCTICGDGFEQKSRLKRHMATAHPPSAPSAADIEKALAGIQYPKTKEDLVQYASQKASSIGQDLFDLIKSLPDRTYRDSAEVGNGCVPIEEEEIGEEEGDDADDEEVVENEDSGSEEIEEGESGSGSGSEDESSEAEEGPIFG
jgi:hypothetical protein